MKEDLEQHPSTPTTPVPRTDDAPPSDDTEKAEAQCIYHFVCDQCGHTWWSNNLDLHCRWGCPSGRAMRL